MGVDRKVEIGPERHRHHQFPPARQRQFASHLIGAVNQQAVQSHRALFAAKACCDPLDPCEQSGQRIRDRCAIRGKCRIGGAVAGDPQRKTRLPFGVGICKWRGGHRRSVLLCRTGRMRQP
jgi:hypothetical protein